MLDREPYKEIIMEVSLIMWKFIILRFVKNFLEPFMGESNQISKQK